MKIFETIADLKQMFTDANVALCKHGNTILLLMVYTFNKSFPKKG